MSKELWFQDFEYMRNELADSELTDQQIEEEAIAYADGCMKRLVDHADNLRKAERENGRR